MLHISLQEHLCAEIMGWGLPQTPPGCQATYDTCAHATFLQPESSWIWARGWAGAWGLVSPESEPRAAREPRRGQKPPGGRFWEAFRGTGAGRRGSRGLPWPPGQGPQAEVGLPAPTCRLVRSQEL